MAIGNSRNCNGHSDLLVIKGWVLIEAEGSISKRDKVAQMVNPRVISSFNNAVQSTN